MTRKEIAPGIFISFHENTKAAQDLEQKIIEELREPTPIAAKVEYVVRQPQSRYHVCHWPDCNEQVPPSMWGCAAHWRRIPRVLQRKIWSTYEIGQEVSMTPSRAYLDAADEVQQWIREHAL